jgi:hypothetical protein
LLWNLQSLAGTVSFPSLTLMVFDVWCPICSEFFNQLFYRQTAHSAISRRFIR